MVQPAETSACPGACSVVLAASFRTSADRDASAICCFVLSAQ